jgi:hypothetical protein
MYPDHDVASPTDRAPRMWSRARIDAGSRDMSCPYALAEMLRQLYSAGQAKAADVLLARCSLDGLQRLLDESSAFLGARVRYAVVEHLRHRKPLLEETALSTMRAIASVLNAWLHDGRRLAIRAVLREFSGEELRELAALPELNDEVATMTGDFS